MFHMLKLNENNQALVIFFREFAPDASVTEFLKRHGFVRTPYKELLHILNHVPVVDVGIRIEDFYGEHAERTGEQRKSQRFEFVDKRIALVMLVYEHGQACERRRDKKRTVSLSALPHALPKQLVYTMEDTVLDRLAVGHVLLTMRRLPPTQMRRLYAHKVCGLTTVEIAHEEGVAQQSVHESISAAWRKFLVMLKTTL